MKTPAQAAEDKSKGPTFKRHMITGFVIILPIFISIWVVVFVTGQIHRSVTPIVYKAIKLFGLEAWGEQAWATYVAPVVSVLLFVSLIYILGVIGGNVLGRQLLKGVDKLLMQIPLVRGVYSATRQFLDTFSGDKSESFKRVVLVEYPRKNLWALALVTTKATGEVPARTGQKMIGLFLPTTPNPTSGWLVFVAEEETIPLEMSVDDAFKMIISGGILTPPYSPKTENDTALASSSPTKDKPT